MGPRFFVELEVGRGASDAGDVGAAVVVEVGDDAGVGGHASVVEDVAGSSACLGGLRCRTGRCGLCRGSRR